MQDSTSMYVTCMRLEFGTCLPVIAGMARAAKELKQHESGVQTDSNGNKQTNRYLFEKRRIETYGTQYIPHPPLLVVAYGKY